MDLPPLLLCVVAGEFLFPQIIPMKFREPWETQIYFLRTEHIRIYWMLGYRPESFFSFRGANGSHLNPDGSTKPNFSPPPKTNWKWGVIRIYRFVILWDFIPRVQFLDENDKP